MMYFADIWKANFLPQFFHLIHKYDGPFETNTEECSFFSRLSEVLNVDSCAKMPFYFEEFVPKCRFGLQYQLQYYTWLKWHFRRFLDSVRARFGPKCRLLLLSQQPYLSHGLTASKRGFCLWLIPSCTNMPFYFEEFVPKCRFGNPEMTFYN